jgi:uncharacterized repeat protein (TIGR03803 family)
MRSSIWVSLGIPASRPGSGRGRATRPRTNGWKKVGLLCALWAASSLAGSAQTDSVAGEAATPVLERLLTFDGTNGANPQAVSAQGRDGNLWGTTQGGGRGNGVVFSMTPGGLLTDVLDFGGPHGAYPAGVVLGTDGYFYGDASFGGTHGDGVVFKVSPTGSETVLFDFEGSNGAVPVAPLTLGADGSFYGITSQGGTTSTEYSPFGCGTVFRITPTGKLTVLHNFDGTHGSQPQGLAQGSDGSFYGTTNFGGSGTSTPCDDAGCGVLFKITPAGAFTVLHDFDGSDGAAPASLVEGTDGNFYGTTGGGGVYGYGTVFKMTPTGTLSTLHNFSGACDDGALPGALTEGTDGDFYGATNGDSSECTTRRGTIFQITPEGDLHAFEVWPVGAEPDGGLLQHTNGVFYGTTSLGGTTNDCGYDDGGCGTVFSMYLGLGPFIKTVLNFGRVGSTVQILGTGLTGATAVTFNGKPATCFSVVSDTFMEAMVPDGATTGPIEVTTPKGTLKSNVNFNVQ